MKLLSVGYLLKTVLVGTVMVVVAAFMVLAFKSIWLAYDDPFKWPIVPPTTTHEKWITDPV